MWNNYHNWHQPWPSLTICFLFLFFYCKSTVLKLNTHQKSKRSEIKGHTIWIYKQIPKTPISCFRLWMNDNSQTSILRTMQQLWKTNPTFPIYTSPRKYGDGWGFCIVRFDAWDRFDWKWQNRSIERDWRDQKSELAVFLLLVHLLFIGVVQS